MLFFFIMTFTNPILDYAMRARGETRSRDLTKKKTRIARDTYSALLEKRKSLKQEFHLHSLQIQHNNEYYRHNLKFKCFSHLLFSHFYIVP